MRDVRGPEALSALLQARLASAPGLEQMLAVANAHPTLPRDPWMAVAQFLWDAAGRDAKQA